MKIAKTVERNQCDFCQQSDDCFDECLGCHKDVCYHCTNSAGIKYPHSVACTGYGDGFYCHKCDKDNTTVLHAAYVTIKKLKERAEAFYQQYREDAKEAESFLKKLLDKQEQ